MGRRPAGPLGPGFDFRGYADEHFQRLERTASERSFRQALARCPAYRGCERLRGSIRASFEAVGLPRLTPRRRARMYLHANAKLGLAGRSRSSQAIEGGCSLRAAAAAFSVSPATAHRWWHRWLEASEEARRRSLVCSIARAGRAARRASSRRSAGADLRLPPRDGLGAAPGRRRDRLCPLDGLEGAPARTGSRGRRGAAKEPRTATSGPAPATCCTWTSAATPASSGPAIAVTGDRSQRSRNWMRPRPASATTTRTRSSTTTPGSPTSSSTTTRAPRPSPASSNARSPSSPSTGITAKRLMTDNAFSYVKNRSLRELLADRGSGT